MKTQATINVLFVALLFMTMSSALAYTYVSTTQRFTQNIKDQTMTKLVDNYALPDVALGVPQNFTINALSTVTTINGVKINFTSPGYATLATYYNSSKLNLRLHDTLINLGTLNLTSADVLTYTITSAGDYSYDYFFEWNASSAIQGMIIDVTEVLWI